MEQEPTFANLRYTKRWYDFYYQRVVIRQRPVEELQEVKSQRPVDLSETQKKECQIEILQRVVEELEMPPLSRICNPTAPNISICNAKRNYLWQH